MAEYFTEKMTFGLIDESWRLDTVYKTDVYFLFCRVTHQYVIYLFYLFQYVPGSQPHRFMQDNFFVSHTLFHGHVDVN